MVAEAAELARPWLPARTLRHPLLPPPSLELRRFDGLTRGLLQEARLHACPWVGGNLARGREILVSATTKDLMTGALRSSLHLVAATRSYNNEIGVPLTLLAADDDTDVIVVEMAMRGEGQIRVLAGIARRAEEPQFRKNWLDADDVEKLRAILVTGEACDLK